MIEHFISTWGELIVNIAIAATAILTIKNSLRQSRENAAANYITNERIKRFRDFQEFKANFLTYSTLYYEEKQNPKAPEERLFDLRYKLLDNYNKFRALMYYEFDPDRIMSDLVNEIIAFLDDSHPKHHTIAKTFHFHEALHVFHKRMDVYIHCEWQRIKAEIPDYEEIPIPKWEDWYQQDMDKFHLHEAMPNSTYSDFQHPNINSSKT